MPYTDPEKRRENTRRWRSSPAGKASRRRYNLSPKRRACNWKNNYGISIEQFEKMLEMQGGVCAICHRPETQILYGKVRLLSVDHDHITGAVRGLLCSECNRGIGQLGDDPLRVESAARYLRGEL